MLLVGKLLIRGEVRKITVLISFACTLSLVLDSNYKVRPKDEQLPVLGNKLQLYCSRLPHYEDSCKYFFSFNTHKKYMLLLIMYLFLKRKTQHSSFVLFYL